MTREGDTILQETTQLRRRHDDLTAECAAVRQKPALLVVRRDGFVPTSHLDANKDEDAAEVAGLEDELAEVEHATDVANHERKTYELMIERIRSEEKTYRVASLRRCSRVPRVRDCSSCMCAAVGTRGARDAITASSEAWASWGRGALRRARYVSFSR